MTRIGIVDDDRDIAEVLRRGLELNGFQVDAYTDPEVALEKFQPGMYDLMIIDIRMPKLTGFELFRELRKKEPSVRVVFLTAFEMYYDEFRKIFPTTDVRAFIKKPVTMSALVSQVKALLSQKPG